MDTFFESFKRTLTSGSETPKTASEPEPDPAPMTKVEDKKEIVLSSTIQEACAGAGGTKIIAHLLKEEKLVVIDVKEAKVVGTIPAPGSRVFFAAGKKDLVLALPQSKVVESWNLDKFTKNASKPLPAAIVKTLAMWRELPAPL